MDPKPKSPSSPTTESDKLLCTICGSQIPEGRDRRQTATCSEPCKDKLDGIRARQRASRRCTHCLHPSTPAQREDFRLWQAERGMIKNAELIPRDHSGPTKRALKDAIRGARETLKATLALCTVELPEDAMQRIAKRLTAHQGKRLGQLALTAQIELLEDLVDKRADVGATLAGNAAVQGDTDETPVLEPDDVPAAAH